MYIDTQYVSMYGQIYHSVELRLMPFHYDRALPGWCNVPPLTLKESSVFEKDKEKKLDYY